MRISCGRRNRQPHFKEAVGAVRNIRQSTSMGVGPDYNVGALRTRKGHYNLFRQGRLWGMSIVHELSYLLQPRTPEEVQTIRFP